MIVFIYSLYINLYEEKAYSVINILISDSNLFNFDFSFELLNYFKLVNTVFSKRNL